MKVFLPCLALYAALSYALGAWLLVSLRRSVPPHERPSRGAALAAWALSPLVFGVSLAVLPAGVWEWARGKRKGVGR